MFCPRCGTSNDDSASFCSSCGNALPQGVQSADPARLPQSVTDLYKAVIGPQNQAHYLRHFSRFDGQGTAGVSWHWPAFFITFYWLLYRKMWLNAFAYFLLPYVLMIPIGITAGLASSSQNVAQTIIFIGWLMLLLAVWTLPPMYANAIYYNHCKKRISEASALSTDPRQQLASLALKGGTSWIAVIIVMAFVFVGSIGVLAAIAIPQYVVYKQTAVDAAMKSDLHNAATAMEAFYGDNGNSYRGATGAHLTNYGYRPNPGRKLEISRAGERDYELRSSASGGSAPSWVFDSTTGSITRGP